MQLPVVSTLHACMAEPVHRSIDGLLALERDVEAHAAEPDRILDHRESFGAGSRFWIRERMDAVKQTEKLLRVISSLLTKRTGAEEYT